MKKFLLVSLIVLLVFGMIGCSNIDNLALNPILQRLCRFIVEENLDEIVLLHAESIEDEARSFYNHILNSHNYSEFKASGTKFNIIDNKATITTNIKWTRTAKTGGSQEKQTKKNVEFSLTESGFLKWEFSKVGAEGLFD